MKLFTSRIRKDVDELRKLIGEKSKTSIFDEVVAYCTTFGVCQVATPTIMSRLEALEKENRQLRAYLGIELHTTAETTEFRKIPKWKK